MKTATTPNYETLMQLATEHPEKLDAINDFLKNMILLVDIAGKAGQKKEHGLTVTTTKTKCGGYCPVKPFSYYVIITDGYREAHFLNDGRNCLTLADFASGENANKLQFWGHSGEPGVIHKLGQWEKGQKRNLELCDMQEFINECLNVPIKYAEVGEMTYTY